MTRVAVPPLAAAARAGLAYALVAAGPIACAAPRPPSALVIVTLDTTRADRLPAYGFASLRTPAIDDLARAGVVFDRAQSVAPLTLPAHTSLFTGLYPFHHGVHENAGARLGSAPATLAQLLHDRGFRTAAFVGSAVLRSDRGLARGFDVYSDGAAGAAPAPPRRSATAVIAEANAWVESLDGAPFFLWVHLYDVHAPQTLPLEFRREFGDTYEAGIAYVDSEVGRLAAALRRKGRFADAAIVVAADHGESLGEHGEREHGIFLYDGTIHVPLIVRAPGIEPRRVRDVVSLVDVLPTVLDLFGLAAPPLDGRSLLPLAKGRRLPERAVYAESLYPTRFGWSPLRMLRDAQMKYIQAPRPELYDLDRDPSESKDLSTARPRLADGMRAELEALRDTFDERAAADRPERVDALRMLSSLGYVARAAAPAQRNDGSALDPKDYIQEFNRRRPPFIAPVAVRP